MGELSFSFQDKNVVVTGAAQGIGFEIAKRFLQAGATVTLVDSSEEGLQIAKKELANFSKARTQKVDVTDRSSCSELAEKVDGLNILINNAGITRDKSFGKMTDEDFDKVVNTNLTGVYNVTKALLPKFSDQAPKRIVSMASVVALYGNFGQTNYVATKAGVIGMTKTWARELARKGFTANAVAPGFIRTKMTEAMPAEVLQGMANKVPAGRLGETSDIANAVLFLSSSEASYVNGTVFSVDGGLVV